jgi:hypothetical protein
MRNPFVSRIAPRDDPTAFVLNVRLAGLGAIRGLGRCARDGLHDEDDRAIPRAGLIDRT